MAGEILVIVNSDLQVTVQNNVVQATVIAPPPTLVNVTSPVVPTSIEVISTGPPGPAGPPGVGELNPNHSLLINLDADDHNQYHNDARHALIDHSGLPGVGGGGSGHVIEDEGVPLATRGSLNFVGSGVAVTDDLGNDATVVTISGGGAGAVTSVNTQTGDVVLNAADVGADPDGAAVSEVTSHEGNTGVHTITGVTGLQTALDGKSGTSHDHNADYEPVGAVAVHAVAGDPHSQYLTPAEADAAYEVINSVSTHEGAGDPHTGYQLESEKGSVNGYAPLDGTGKVPEANLPAGQAPVTDHSNLTGLLVDDHTQYLTDARGDLRYDPIGTVSTHEGAGDPHSQYLTPAEADAAYEVINAVSAHETVHAPDNAITATDHSGIDHAGITGVVSSVNTQTGIVTLNAADVGADPAGTATGAVATHEGAGDPHTGYQLESEKSVANGYASLDAGVLVPIAEIPTGSSNTTVSLGDHNHDGAYEVASAVSTHEAGTGVHTIAGTTGLQTALDAKEPVSWDGTAAQYTALGTYDANTTYYVVG